MSQPRRSNGRKNYFRNPSVAPKRAKEPSKEGRISLNALGNKRAFFIFLLCFLLLVVFFTSLYIRNVRTLHELQQTRDELMVEKQNLILTNQELKEVYGFINTKEYIIYMARKLLGWVMPDDEKYTLVPEGESN